MPATSNKMVFVDVDTQIDFMLPEGHLYVPGAETIIPNLARLMKFALEHRVPVVSSVDAHPRDDPEFQQFPPHCVKGTPGQQKIPETLLPIRTLLLNEDQPPIADTEFAAVQQWMLEKQKFDLFTNVNAVRLFSRLGAERFVVFGVATEYCVKAAVLGLLRLGKPVTLVLDATRGIERENTAQALAEVTHAGAKFANVDEIG